MSSSLRYRIVVTEAQCLDNELKRVLKLEFQLPRVFTYADLGLLRGIEIAGIEGARDLIDLIERHEEVELYEIY